MNNAYPVYQNPAFSGIIGIAQGDITPPVGIYARNWGAAKTDVAMGIHMPLVMVCITFQSSADEKPLVLISADLGWWKNMDDERFLREGILETLNLEPQNLMICLSHTHSGPSICRGDVSKPGGEYIEPYLGKIKQQAITLIKESLSKATPATLTWKYGVCNLATNRDLPDLEKDRIVVGFNPANPADDTLLVGRITDSDEKIIGTIVNYACHPTVLAWDNQLISPDYVGAMRELVVQHTHAPCLFLQGASGELAAAEQYSGDTNLAEKHGRQIGFAVLSTMESMLTPKYNLQLNAIVESGAPLAVWKQAPANTSTKLAARLVKVKLPLKDLPSVQEIQTEIDSCTDRVLMERLWRKLNVRKAVGNSEEAEIPLWVWQLGNSFLIGQPNEAYSHFQISLREQFPESAIAVMNVVNGHIGYLPDSHLYNNDIYSVWQTPFAKGSLEQLIDVTRQTISSFEL